MKIALAQLQIAWEDKEANLEKAESCLKLLKGKDIDLFLLPEMSLTGFSMNTAATKENDRQSVRRIQNLAARYHTAFGVGWVKDCGGKCENHYSLVTPRGELLDYAKLHPFRYGGETEYFTGGDKLPVCEHRGVRIGVQICYDLRFPEPFQILSRTADLIIVPANWPAARREHWNCLLKARAVENLVYIAAVNCAGEMGGQYYRGDSALYAPDGSVCPAQEMLPGGCPEERLLIAEVRPDTAEYRKRFPMKEDRRGELYMKLAKEGIE